MTEKVGRNDPCACGSGKKQKKCCGAGFDANAFLDEAGRLSPKRVFRHVDGWELQLSFADLGDMKEVFYLSAMLYPPMRPPKGDDWKTLGRLVNALGGPRDPVLRWEEFHPNAPHHFAWDKDGRVEIPEVGKEALRKAQLQRLQRLGDASLDAHVHCKAVDCNEVYRGLDAELNMRGHVMREHPEELSDEAIDRLAGDERAMVAIHKEAAVSPELWKKLLDRIKGRVSSVVNRDD